MRVLPRYMYRSVVLVSGLMLALASGCGDGDGRLVSSNGGGEATDDGQGDDGIDTPMTPELARDYIEEQDAVIMPWTREVSGPLLDQAELGEDRISFPTAGNDDSVGQYEKGDVLVSADTEKPFLRKITNIEVVDDQYVVHTRHAKLGEAIYKGGVNTADQTAGQRGEPMQQGDYDTRRQFLEPDKESFGDGSTSTPHPDEQADPNFPIDISMSPSVSVTPSFYFDMKIEPTANTNANHNHFYSPHQRCPGGDASYCDPQVGGPNMNYESYCAPHNGTADVCQFRQDGFTASCDTVVGALDYAEENPDCQAMFDKFYKGEYGAEAYSSDIWNNSACDYWGYGYWMPPHPVHMDWAKENCSGAVKRLVVDAEVDATATTGDITIAAEDWSSDDSYTVWQSEDKLLARKVFFIGWLPVLITSNASLRVEAEYEASLEASLTFDGMTLSGLTFGGGFAKYASSAYEDDKGVTVDGQFERYSQGNYGSWHQTPLRTPTPTLEGLELQNKEVLGTLEGTMSAKLSAIPRVDLLLYDLAGPYVEPLIPYGEIQLAAGGTLSSIDGFDAAGGTCSDSAASICARVGAQGKVGITAENICDGCNWDTPLSYNTCSDYCPDNEEALCGKWCYDGNDVEPVKIDLEWSNDSVDLDLRMTSPDNIDYQDRTPNSNGWVHSGDTCPSSFGGGCNGQLQNGVYTESIWLDGSATMPNGSTLYRVEVETFDATASGQSFDLQVYQDGQSAQSFTRSAPANGDTTTIEFTLP